jgi:thiamine-phosphate pyrophosphorylase
MRVLADCRLYSFVDAAYLRGRDPVEIGRALCAGGADVVQLRAKHWAPEEVRRVGKGLCEVCRAAGVWFVVNDFPEVALELGAPLCHLGQEDFFDAGWQHASEVLPPDAGTGLGLSTHSPAQATRAVAAGPAYVAVGPVYATATKPGRAPVTLEYVRWAAEHIGVPWFAIGGITLANLDQVRNAGAERVCVVSAILEADDVTAACREFRTRLDHRG